MQPESVRETAKGALTGSAPAKICTHGLLHVRTPPQSE